jgi:hypothetical protein
VADTFLQIIRTYQVAGESIDARENVKFRGRYVASWVHQNYGELACALAIELKKVWMDEWTGEVDVERRAAMRDALLATVDPVTAAWRTSAGL